MEIYESCNMVSFRKAMGMMEEFAVKIERNEKAMSKIYEYKDDEELAAEDGMKELAKTILFNLPKLEQEEISVELDELMHDETREELLKVIDGLEDKVYRLGHIIEEKESEISELEEHADACNKRMWGV